MANHNCVWIVDDDRSIRWVLERAFEKEGIECRSFESGEALLRKLDQDPPDAIVSDVRMEGIDGLELLSRIHDNHPHLPVIIMTAHSDLESAVASFQGGAFEYLPKPFDVDDAVSLALRAIEHTRQKQKTSEPAVAPANTEIIGEAPAMQEVFRAIGRLSQSNITVLINGESGTGKELVAHALHRHSPRRENPFIALNMAAIPRDLMESELFGHEKGSFTGAQGQRRGRFEQADGEFYRVGGHTSVRVDVRIIAATHQNLETLVKEGRFREDLFHRLNVIRIHLPRLADRREDIPRLLEFFLHKAADELGVETKTLRPETEAYLSRLAWPGNVRQLENICRWITVMASGREVLVSDLPPELMDEAQTPVTSENWEQALRNWADRELARGEHRLLDIAVPNFERIMIETALKHTAGRRRDAAELLGWGRNTLTRKIKELGMELETVAEDEE